ncbi:MAG: hypothetical protein ACRC5T_10505 [Cetobacterium sp.]
MRIISTNKVLVDEYHNLNVYIKSFLSNTTGFHELAVNTQRKHIPKMPIDKNIINTIKSLKLDKFETNSDDFRYFVRCVDLFTTINTVSITEYRAEIISEFFALNDINILLYIETLYNNKSISDFKMALGSKYFSKMLYNKLNADKKLEVLKKWFSEKEFLISADLKGYNSPINNYKDLLNIMNEVLDLYSSKGKLTEESEISYKYYESLTTAEKKEWITKYNNQIDIYNFDVLKQTSKLTETLGITNLFSPETELIDKMKVKYQKLLNSLELDDSNCRVFKSLIYVAIYLIRKNSNGYKPAESMKSLVGADVSWAVGSEQTREASFYGDSEIGKFFYGYGPYMTGEINPYSAIISNGTLNAMDNDAIAINDFFRDVGIDKIVYDLLFEREIVSGKSIYDLLGSVKDLIEVIESPIMVSSVLNDALSMFKGIISSMINTAITAIDFGLTQAMKELFYVDFIPFGGKKHSLGDLYNYAVFLKLILEQVDGTNRIELIDKEVFIKNAYVALGFSSDEVKKTGYLSYSRELNNTLNVILKQDLVADDNHINITCDVHFKLFYTLIQFAKQKRSSRYTLKTDDDHSSINGLDTLIETLSSEEKFWVFKLYLLDFSKLNEIFTEDTLEVYLDFNETILNIKSIYDHSDISLGLVNGFEKEEKISLVMEMESVDFKEINIDKIISGFLKNYGLIVEQNKVLIESQLFESNGIADIDDFLMRYLPAFVELSKTLGYSDGTIKSLIKMLDYFCNFIANVLFKEYFFKIKIEINTRLKSFSDSMFEKISSITDKFNFDDIILNFDIGGSAIVKNIDSLMKAMEDGVEALSKLRMCFHDENFKISDTVNKDSEDRETEEDSSSIDFLDRNSEVIVKTNSLSKDEINKLESIITTSKENLNEQILDKLKTPSNGVKLDQNGDISFVYNTKDKKSDDNEKTVEETTKIKNQIIDVAKIKDKIDSLTNVEYVDTMNKLIISEQKLKEELSKMKPSQVIIKETKKTIEELNKKIVEIKPGIKQNVLLNDERNGTIDFAYVEEVFISDVVDGEYNFDRVGNLLDNIQEVVFENNLPLTNHEIIKLLK